jgi:hypothetical protein
MAIMAATLMLPALLSNAFEGEGTVFGVSPPSLELSGLPGEQISAVLKISNESKKAAQFSIKVLGYVATGKTIVQRALGSLPASHIARNITFETPTVMVPARSKKDFNIFIKIPEVAKGTQYAGVAITRQVDDALPSERSSEYERNVGVGMQPGIGVNIRVNVKGEMNFAYMVDGVKVQPSTATQPPSLVAVIRNTGNGELRVNPVVVLVDSAGKSGIRMRSSETVVLTPGSQKEVKFVHSGTQIPKGNYKAIFTIPDPNYKLAPIETSIVIK